MSPDYHIQHAEARTEPKTAAERLAFIYQLLPHPEKPLEKYLGRNALTRTLDGAFGFVRKYLPPLHWFFAAITALVVFFYAQIVALTARLITAGSRSWPDVPAPAVLALWHGDAPSLLVAFAKQWPRCRTVIMVARDSRGDFLALLCRMIGFGVVRGDSEKGGWEALVQLADELMRGASVILTADGGGPVRVAKVGAVALASSVGVPLIPLSADCHPAIEESHKWDAARNPVPFCSLTITLGRARRFDFLEDLSSVEEARTWLENTLNSI